jgi:hypothetical protein
MRGECEGNGEELGYHKRNGNGVAFSFREMASRSGWFAARNKHRKVFEGG